MLMKISTARLPQLYAAIEAEMPLYLPLPSGGKLNFARWTPEAQPDLATLKTVRSAKDFFFPQTEGLARFEREGGKITVDEAPAPDAPFALFGVRGCDVHSFAILDKVFLSEPADSFYAARRAAGLVIALACPAPAESCFCTAFGIHPGAPGADVDCWLAGDTLYWQANTPKGDSLTQTLAPLLEQAGPEGDAAVAEAQNKAEALAARMPLASLDPAAVSTQEESALFDAPLWQPLSEACLACGTCTFVCPTCQCYDIRDYDTGHGVQRYRCWDSCMYADFTLMAHGNPRTTKAQRFRQRFMHKLAYFPANNGGLHACVGCGRCVENCPVSMHIAKIMAELAGTGVQSHV